MWGRVRYALEAQLAFGGRGSFTLKSRASAAVRYTVAINETLYQIMNFGDFVLSWIVDCLPNSWPLTERLDGASRLDFLKLTTMGK